MIHDLVDKAEIKHLPHGESLFLGKGNQKIVPGRILHSLKGVQGNFLPKSKKKDAAEKKFLKSHFHSASFLFSISL
jgi:hypothetical protein